MLMVLRLPNIFLTKIIPSFYVEKGSTSHFSPLGRKDFRTLNPHTIWLTNQSDLLLIICDRIDKHYKQLHRRTARQSIFIP